MASGAITMVIGSLSAATATTRAAAALAAHD